MFLTAENQAVRMAEEGELSHDLNLVQNLVNVGGFPPGLVFAASENCFGGGGRGYGGLYGFYRSAPHAANMFNPDMDMVSWAIAENGGARHYEAMQFARVPGLGNAVSGFAWTGEFPEVIPGLFVDAGIPDYPWYKTSQTIDDFVLQVNGVTYDTTRTKGAYTVPNLPTGTNFISVWEPGINNYRTVAVEFGPGHTREWLKWLREPDGTFAPLRGTERISSVVGDVPPAANPDTVTTAFNTAAVFRPLDNDTFYKGANHLSFVSLGSVDPGMGSVAIEGDDIRFTPADGFSGTFRLTYGISASGETGTPLTDQGEITVTVQPKPNQPPVAVAFGPELRMGESKEIDLRSLLTDPEGDPFSVVATTNPTYLTLETLDAFTIRLTPVMLTVPNITLRVTQGSEVNFFTVRFVIRSANQAPYLVGPRDYAVKNTPSGYDGTFPLEILDGEGDPVAIASVALSDPARGRVSALGNSLVVQFNPGVVGSYSVSVEVTDGRASRTETLRFRVSPPTPPAPPASQPPAVVAVTPPSTSSPTLQVEMSEPVKKIQSLQAVFSVWDARRRKWVDRKVNLSAKPTGSSFGLRLNASTLGLFLRARSVVLQGVAIDLQNARGRFSWPIWLR
jgi:hypothetical protein